MSDLHGGGYACSQLARENTPLINTFMLTRAIMMTDKKLCQKVNFFSFIWAAKSFYFTTVRVSLCVQRFSHIILILTLFVIINNYLMMFIATHHSHIERGMEKYENLATLAEAHVKEILHKEVGEALPARQRTRPSPSPARREPWILIAPLLALGLSPAWHLPPLSPSSLLTVNSCSRWARVESGAWNNSRPS